MPFSFKEWCSPDTRTARNASSTSRSRLCGTLCIGRKIGIVMLATPASGDSIVNFLELWNLGSGSSSIQVEAGECLRRESAERRFGLYRIWHLKWGGRFWKTLPSVKSFALECVYIVRQCGYLEAVFAKFTFKAVAPQTSAAEHGVGADHAHRVHRRAPDRGGRPAVRCRPNRR